MYVNKSWLKHYLLKEDRKFCDCVSRVSEIRWLSEAACSCQKACPVICVRHQRISLTASDTPADGSLPESVSRGYWERVWMRFHRGKESAQDVTPRHDDKAESQGKEMAMTSVAGKRRVWLNDGHIIRNSPVCREWEWLGWPLPYAEPTKKADNKMKKTSSSHVNYISPGDTTRHAATSALKSWRGTWHDLAGQICPPLLPTKKLRVAQPFVTIY